jgi:eukaryotic-like serine/threonine-protein kinase
VRWVHAEPRVLHAFAVSAHVTQECVSADAAAAYAAGRLTPKELASIDDHIDVCVMCRKLLSRAAELVTSEPRTSAGAGDPGPDGDTNGRIDSLSPGAVVGRYVVDDRIGAGGMGVVYAVHDPELGRKVALKVLRVGLVFGDRSAEDLLRREAMAMARIAHPNVVGVHDLFVANGTMFVAMELIFGTTLREWLGAARRPWREILHVVTLAGRGLAAAHAEGVVHRDFKPENVLVGRSGRVCVSDFGLSRFAAAPATLLGGEGTAPDGRAAGAGLTIAGGTPRYMAPEQRAADGGGRGAAASDQFSFSVVLYEALYGEHPFGDDSSSRKARGWEVRPAPPRATIPAWVRRCILRGLRPEPRARYGKMEDMLADLGRDPRVARRRVAIGLAVTALFGVGAAAWAHSRDVRRDVCAHADRKLAGVWDEGRKSGAARSFDAIGTPFAKDELGFVERALDRYTRRWVDARTQACEIALAHGPPADVDGDPRVSCLDDRLEETRAVVDGVIGVADAEQIAKAVTAADSIQPVESCARVAALPRHAARKDSAREGRARADLARAAALSYFGKYDEAAVLAERAAEAAEQSGSDALEASALRWAAHAHENSGHAKPEMVESQYYRAIAVADAAGDDATRAAAWSGLLFLGGIVERKLGSTEASRFFDQGMSAVRRLGGDDRLEALLRNALASVLSELGEHEKVRAEFELALGAATRAGYALLAGEILDNMAQADILAGDLEAAEQHVDRAEETLRQVVGDGHWFVLSVRGDKAALLVQNEDFRGAKDLARGLVDAYAGGPRANRMDAASAIETLAEAHLGLAEYEEARSMAARSLAIRERLEVPPPALTAPLACLGRAELGLHRPEAALEPLERAVSSNRGEPAERADARFALALALSYLHRDAARAIALGSESRDILDEPSRRTPLVASLRERVHTWLGCASSAWPPRSECLTPPAHP